MHSHIRGRTVFAAAVVALMFAATCGDDGGAGTVVCGDEVCEGDENSTNCPEDCYCGNDTCESNEDGTSCPEDCAECGNGVIEPNENCEGTDLGGEDCVSQGYASGTLTCTAQCRFDFSGCVPSVCGNGLAETGESCDGSDLAGADCISEGFASGTLACGSDCAFDTTGCVSPVCGNHVCEPGEDSQNCSVDCPAGCGDSDCAPMEGESCGNCPMDCVCGDDDCYDFIVCFYQCTDNGCVETCFEQGCAEAQETSSLILSCMAAQCSADCADPSDNACRTCIYTHCAVGLGACYQVVCPGTCGDGNCDTNAGEDHTNCPEDCPFCGNQNCEDTEDATSCPQDCSGDCGDDFCDPTEDCSNCSADCGSCPPTCGNNACDPIVGESCATCPQDCSCGNLTCTQVIDDCMTACGSDAQCVEACFQSGCYEAQIQAQALYQCMLSNCAALCSQDPSGNACLFCLGASCGSEYTACQDGTCP